MKKLYLSLLFLCIGVSLSWATHIVGGEFALRYTGRGQTYELSLSLYFDDINGNPGAEDMSIRAAIYSKRSNQLITTVNLPRISAALVNYTNPQCTYARLQTRQILYASEIQLDSRIYNEPEGYYVSWERCCRNNIINNIVAPGSSGMTFYLEFPPVVQNNQRFINNSPVFTMPKGDYACVNQPFTFEFGATDPDGDMLRYTLVTPYQGYSSVQMPSPYNQTNPVYRSGPYPTVTWSAGVNLQNVIPGSPSLRVDRGSGQLTFTANRTGLYVFSVLCEEFRDGRKIGEVRRDFQLMVIDCPKFVAPKVKMNNPEPGKSGLYQAGQVIKLTRTADRCFDLAITDSSQRDVINLQLKPLNFPENWVTLSRTQGTLNGPTDTLHTQLCWSDCAQNPPGQPLAFDIIASDNSCPLPKRDTLRVLVEFEPDDNQPPLVTTSLPGNKAAVIAGDGLQFDVTGTDPDNDQILLEAVGRGFNLRDLGMSFASISGTGNVTSPFNWQPDCDKVKDGETYIVDFIVRDQQECPEVGQADTISVELTFRARDSRPPEVSTSLLTNRVRVNIGEEIRFDVIGTDPDNDPITLRAVGRGFRLSDVGMVFRNTSGVGTITEPFFWTPTCDNTERERMTYVVDFIVEDNSCTANRFDTITVEFDMSDFEVVVTEFLPPNVFTPNGDQANECFEIPEDKLPPDNCKDWFERIEIYNRWGKMVYQSQARNFQWCVEGDFTTGTYYYLVYYRNSKYKGTVSLLR